MTNQLKLTALSSKAGWGCKIGPEDLAQVLRYLPKETNDPNLLVGMESPDDGSVYKLTDDIALIQTVDFFTPIVDDPYMFGQIAAANSMSDVYAMGGTPKTVLNIVAFPIEQLGPEVLAEILKGSSDKVKEAGALVVGGHSIDDKEPKFGLSVTGLVHPEEYYKNTGARPGEILVLTKPIGVGILTTGLKNNLLTQEQIDHVSEMMSTLNKHAAECLKDYHPSAVTDITGFGLLGHAYEMASGSEVSFEINYNNVLLLPGAKELAEQQIFPAGSRTNHAWLKDDVNYAENISPVEELILCDSITSGGLLISLPASEAASYVDDLKTRHSIEANIIGKVIEENDKSIYVKWKYDSKSWKKLLKPYNNTYRAIGTMMWNIHYILIRSVTYLEEKEDKSCNTGGWGLSKTNTSSSKRKFKLPAIWPGVYVWLLVGVFFIISSFFN